MAEEAKPQDAVDWESELATFLNSTQAGRDAVIASRDNKPHDEKALADFTRDFVRFQAMSMKGQPYVIPTSDPVKSPDAWRSTSDELMEVARGATPHPAVHAYANMADAFRTGRAAEFNSAASDYLAQLRPQFGTVCAKAVREQFFNRLSPFTKAMAIYAFGALFAMCFWFAPVSGRMAAPHGGDALPARARHPRGRSHFPHGARRPSAGDESLFRRRLHRLGCVRARAGARDRVAQRHRRCRLRGRLVSRRCSSRTILSL